MLRRSSLIAVVVALLLTLVTVLPAAAQAPDFGPAIYADGKVWGTKGLSTLPQPNANMLQSFDKLYKFGNSNNADQVPVAEAAPGNPKFNGGRWWAQDVEWTDAAFAVYGTVPVLKSYDDIMSQYDLGYLTITDTSMFFECPLLPVK
jgi:hypothetical protein